jgi:hypothetical protein
LTAHDSVTFHEYIALKKTPVNRERDLPGKGEVRIYQGRRIGRDSRVVEREAVYDPYTDMARERVVDVETGKVIVDKRESMREKYQREGRWKPRPT